VIAVVTNDVDIIGRTALHNAAGWFEREDPLPLVNALIEHGADVNAVDKYGFTALMIAADRTHANVVRRLIEAGASVLARNKGNETALMKAAGAIDNQVEMVTMLLRAGADKTVRDQYGHTAFDAIRSNTDPQLKELLAVQ
jgi:ankyrin repeat protein